MRYFILVCYGALILQTPARAEDLPSWQVPLRQETPKIENLQKKDPIVESYQIPLTEDNSQNPQSEASFFYTPSSGAFIQKFKASNDQLNFNTASGRNFRLHYEYKFNYHYSVGGFYNTSSFITAGKSFNSGIDLQGSSSPITALGGFARWSENLTTLQKKITVELALNRESIPLIDFAPENEALLKTYTYQPTFLNLGLIYQTPLSTIFDLVSFAQYGFPLDSPSINEAKLSKAYHMAFGAAFSSDIMEEWKVQLGFENSSYLAETHSGAAINQSLVSNLIFKLGLTYQWNHSSKVELGNRKSESDVDFLKGN